MAIGTSTNVHRMAELSVWVSAQLPFHLSKMGIVFLFVEEENDIRNGRRRLGLSFSLRAGTAETTDGLVLCCAQDLEVGVLLAEYAERMEAVCREYPGFCGTRVNLVPLLYGPYEERPVPGYTLASAFMPVKKYFEEKLTQAYNVALSSRAYNVALSSSA